ncbi:hypothetical protein BIV60_23585 [Bacillus sp. MUM 116]|uniref:hypothetical protein n=1 Tax=Bacillus sp. MUM 116 TaxID=1678002 RepID=UPI0008F5C3BF|nr:hypothetical protein [Bacillus sp. MUM 116]OIK09578.1 hypothetical protein BIV60_23585 [Bacillus sp. MUM 116]
MKIDKYYRDAACVSLNGSIAALVPAVLIIIVDLSFFRNKEIMMLTIPFLIYSFISFQIYLFKVRQAIFIKRNMLKSSSFYHSIFETEHLLAVYLPKRLQFFFPDGHLAGEIKKYRGKKFCFPVFSKIYALYDFNHQLIGIYKVKQGKHKKIEVFDRNKAYQGYYQIRKLNMRKFKKELFDTNERFIGAVEGASLFMDEKIINSANRQLGRLRRGWMPLEWSKFFPEPNTPVLSFSEGISEQDKLLQMSFLINEYFIER